MLSGFFTGSAADAAAPREQQQQQPLLVKPVQFCDPQSLVAPENAAPPAALWPVSLEERRSVAVAIQSVATSMTYLAAAEQQPQQQQQRSRAKQQQQQQPLSLFALPRPVASTSESFVACSASLPRPLAVRADAAAPSRLAQSVSERLVTVQYCESLRALLCAVRDIEAHFGDRQLTIRVPSASSSTAASLCSAALCSAALQLRAVAAAAAASQAQAQAQPHHRVVTLVLEERQLLPDDGDIASRLLLTLATTALQAHIGAATGQQQQPVFDPKIRIALLIIGPAMSASASVAVARAVDHFDRIVGLVGTVLPPAAAEEEEQPAEVVDEAASTSSFGDVLVAQVAEWFAAKQFAEVEAAAAADDGAAATAADGKRDAVLVVVPPSASSERDDAVAQQLLRALRDDYSTAEVSAAAWSPLTALRGASTIAADLSTVDVVLVSERLLRDHSATDAQLASLLLGRRFSLVIAQQGRSSRFVRSLCAQKLVETGGAAMGEACTAAASLRNASLFFPLIEQAELLLTCFAAPTTTHFVIPRAVVALCAEAVRVLLLSDAIALGSGTSPADRNAFFSAARSAPPSLSALPPSLCLFDIDSTASALQAEQQPTLFTTLRLTPLGRLAAQTACHGVGLIEWRLAVSLSALGQKHRLPQLVAAVWAARMLRERPAAPGASAEHSRCLARVVPAHIAAAIVVATSNSSTSSSSSSSGGGGHDGDGGGDAQLVRLACTYASYPFCPVASSVCASSAHGSVVVVEALVGADITRWAAAPPSLIHVMFSSALSTRLPITNALVVPPAQQQQQRAWDTSSISMAEGMAVAARNSTAAAAATTTEHRLLAGQQQHGAHRAARSRRPGGAVVVVNTAAAAAAAQSVEVTSRVPALAFPGVMTSIQAGNAEQWCAMVPDIMSGTVSGGAWLALPADCTTSLVALKACFRTFCDNAMHLLAPSVVAASSSSTAAAAAALPRMPPHFLAHESVRRLLTDGHADASSSTATTTVGAWVEIQAKRGTLKKSAAAASAVAPAAAVAAAADLAAEAKLCESIRVACGGVLCGVAVRRQRENNASAGAAHAAVAGDTSQAQQQQQQQQQAAPAPAYAPFVGMYPPDNVREFIDQIAPKVIKDGVEKIKKKLAGNPFAVILEERHAFFPYFSWAVATYTARKG